MYGATSLLYLPYNCALLTGKTAICRNLILASVLPEPVMKWSFRHVPMQGLRKGPGALSEVLRPISARARCPGSQKTTKIRKIKTRRA